MRKITNRIHMLLLGALLAGACGVKAPPLSETAAKAVMGLLEYRLEKGRLTLSWQIPEGDFEAFVVYRSRTPFSELDCEGCPLKFSSVARVSSYGPPVYREIPESGYRYVYRVAAVSREGFPISFSETDGFLY